MTNLPERVPPEKKPFTRLGGIDISEEVVREIHMDFPPPLTRECVLHFVLLEMLKLRDRVEVLEVTLRENGIYL